MTAAVEETRTGIGRVTRVIGPVVDAEFPRDAMPQIYAALKVDLGAEFLISQLFYDWSDFLDMEDYLRHKRGVKVPIIPGVLPFLSTKQIKRFTLLCGSKLPQPLRLKLVRAPHAMSHEPMS